MYPSGAESLIYKSPAIESQVRAALALDYPVFSGNFNDHFAGVTLDTNQWFEMLPSWGVITVAGGTVRLSVSAPAISPPWIQSRHNIAFPLSHDVDWVFQTRVRFPVNHGFGTFMRLCGRSFRDAEAVWALKSNLADGIVTNMPDGYTAQVQTWSTIWGAGWMRHRVVYDASMQVYYHYVDADDDGIYEYGPYNVNVAGRYVDAIVIGNSSAVQGTLDAWTEIEVDYVSVTGVAETVVDPPWAAPFTYDGTRMTYLPTMVAGRVSCDKQNVIDAAEIELENFYLDPTMDEQRHMYTNMRFMNRRVVIEGRAGDTAGGWTPWEILFDGLCAERQVEVKGGKATVSIPIRDRWRAAADDFEVIGCYSDARDSGGVPMPIPGVGMNLDVQRIIQDIYRNKCGMAFATHNVTPTPNNTPRTYNIYRASAQQAVKKIADETALCVYQRRQDARIEVQDWPWGTDTPGYHMSTAQDIKSLQWGESAFDQTAAEQMQIENTYITNAGFTHTWPPGRTPYYAKTEMSNSITFQTGADHDARPVAALNWWKRNRQLGSIQIECLAQFWVEHNLELTVSDDRFLGFGRGEYWVVDGWEHAWQGDNVATTKIRLINQHPDMFVRKNLMF